MNKLLITIVLPDKIDDTARIRRLGQRIAEGTKKTVEALIQEGVTEPGEFLVGKEPALVMEVKVRRLIKRIGEE